MKKISDLVINEEYFVCFINDAQFAKKYKLLAIINEKKEYHDNKKTELYLEHSKGTNLVFCNEIGIGKTKKEAKDNYQKFSYEDNNDFSDSFLEVKK